MRRHAFWLLALLLPLTTAQTPDAPLVLLSEIVADPQTDWTRDGRLTGSDEYVELHNPGTETVDLSGWILRMLDSTPAEQVLHGLLPGGARMVVQNPAGDLNNDGHVVLLDARGRIHDEVRYGSWPNATAPSANASDVLDESLRRLQAWTRGPATPARPNDALGWRLQPAPDATEGWVAPGTNVTVHATVLSGPEDPLRSLTLLLENRTLTQLVQENVSRLAASAVLTTNESDMVLTWQADRRIGRETQTLTIRVDASPPRLNPMPATIWRNGSTNHYQGPGANDSGVGNIQYQWRVDGNESTWNPLPRLTLANATVEAQLRARDAFNNTSPWSPPTTFLLDDQAPQVHALHVRQQAGLRLEWTAADQGSGLQGFELVRRVGQQQRLVLLGPSVRSYVEPEPSAPRISYALTPIDLVGNRGPTLHEDVTTPAARPAVTNIRLSKTLWSSGALEVRIDFDRPMNTSHPPILAWTPTLEPAQARYLANRTTYLMTWSSPPAIPDGPLRLHVLDARSADGEPLRAPASAQLVLDRTPPKLQASLTAGFTNQSSVRLLANDTTPVTVTWRLFEVGKERPVREGQSSPPVRIEFPREGEWRLQASATDAAGLIAKEVRWDYFVDRVPPRLEVQAPAGASIAVRAVDNGSGVDWTSLRVTDPQWRALAEPIGGRVIVQPGGENATTTLVLSDFAGNSARISLHHNATHDRNSREEHRTSGPVVDPARLATQARDEQRWWPAALAFMGGIAAAVPIRRTQRRRRRAAGSFAARLRAHRAAQTLVVKEQTTA